MINKKKIIYYLIFISFISINSLKAEIKDSLFISVGNKAITRSDIVNEIKMILILNGKSFNEEQRNQLNQAAISSTIKRNLKSIEIDRYNMIDYNPADLDAELNKILLYLNLSFEELKIVFLKEGLNIKMLQDNLKADLLWNTLIYELYKNRISINYTEIEDQLNNIQLNKKTKEYLLSEIIIPPVKTGDVEEKIKEIKNKINTEGFEKVAMDLSLSETSYKGGDVGWVDENIISDKFKSVIRKTSKNNITEAILMEEGILFFHVRDIRENELNLEPEAVKEQLVNAEKAKILNMHSLTHYNNLQRSISIKYY
jgi:parvulin-like peptidyl-prolyl isomerase